MARNTKQLSQDIHDYFVMLIEDIVNDDELEHELINETSRERIKEVLDDWVWEMVG